MVAKVCFLGFPNPVRLTVKIKDCKHCSWVLCFSLIPGTESATQRAIIKYL